mmetsp:Transcript_25009/g.80609  ORF Transcript_25009/g.80609 Transcript_25009/m.80609 type:complete len:213 (+) Transcript_25009:280-918(+)
MPVCATLSCPTAISVLTRRSDRIRAWCPPLLCSSPSGSCCCAALACLAAVRPSPPGLACSACRQWSPSSRPLCSPSRFPSGSRACRGITAPTGSLPCGSTWRCSMRQRLQPSSLSSRTAGWWPATPSPSPSGAPSPRCPCSTTSAPPSSACCGGGAKGCSGRSCWRSWPPCSAPAWPPCVETCAPRGCSWCCWTRSAWRRRMASAVAPTSRG